MSPARTDLKKDEVKAEAHRGDVRAGNMTAQEQKSGVEQKMGSEAK